MDRSGCSGDDWLDRCLTGAIHDGATPTDSQRRRARETLLRRARLQTQPLPAEPTRQFVFLQSVLTRLTRLTLAIRTSMLNDAPYRRAQRTSDFHRVLSSNSRYACLGLAFVG